MRRIISATAWLLLAVVVFAADPPKEPPPIPLTDKEQKDVRTAQVQALVSLSAFRAAQDDYTAKQAALTAALEVVKKAHECGDCDIQENPQTKDLELKAKPKPEPPKPDAPK